MTITLGNKTVEFIEYRPGEGLVFRIAEDIEGDAAQGESRDVMDALRSILRGSPYFIYRTCCDSAASKHSSHADDCAKAPKKGKGT